MGRSQELNEFEILQRVIEYIQMLEEALGIIVNTERAVDPGGKESLLKSFGDILWPILSWDIEVKFSMIYSKK